MYTKSSILNPSNKTGRNRIDHISFNKVSIFNSALRMKNVKSIRGYLGKKGFPEISKRV